MEKIVLRNLQQQVGKNKDDIQALSEGIKIRGFGEDVPEDLKPGESWLKGTGPYELIVMTDGGQINLGQWPAKGPQGIPGPKGEGAVLGDVSAETTTIEPGLNAYVDVSKDSENLTFRFEIPQGERGIQGLKGETGPKGDTGPQGPQGPQGEARAVSEIVGTLESASALPAPSTVPSYYAYLVGTENNYTVYAIVGGVWKDIGNFTAIPGPQGPKGESYGTFTKTVENGNELGKVLSGLTATQSVVGAYATVGKKKIELIVISYTKVEMIYAWSTFADNPDVPTTATWQAVTSPEAGRFPVGDNYVDSITLYIYDSSKSLMDKVSFIKLDDDGILPQYQIPTFPGTGDIPKDSSSLKEYFGTGSFNLLNGLVLDCFLVMGKTLCVAKLNNDGSENSLTVTDITPLENGAIVCMADGNGHYKNYQVLENTTEKRFSKIWDMLYPMNCRFQLEITLPGNTFLQSMSNVDLKVKMISSPEQQQSSYYVRNFYNSSIYTDASEYHPTSWSKKTFQFLLLDGNYGALMGLNTAANNATSENQCISNIVVKGNSSNGLSTTLVQKLVEYSPLNIGNTANDPACNYWFVTFDKSVYDSSTNKAIRMDYRFEFSPSGMATVSPVPFIIDYTPSTEPAMAKARAMSVKPMSLQAETIQTEPTIPNVPEDAIGIFSVDAEGNTIDAMTGERI